MEGPDGLAGTSDDVITGKYAEGVEVSADFANEFSDFLPDPFVNNIYTDAQLIQKIDEVFDALLAEVQQDLERVNQSNPSFPAYRVVESDTTGLPTRTIDWLQRQTFNVARFLGLPRISTRDVLGRINDIDFSEIDRSVLFNPQRNPPIADQYPVVAQEFLLAELLNPVEFIRQKQFAFGPDDIQPTVAIPLHSDISGLSFANSLANTVVHEFGSFYWLE